MIPADTTPVWARRGDPVMAITRERHRDGAPRFLLGDSIYDALGLNLSGLRLTEFS